MRVGDLVKVIYDGTTGIVVRIVDCNQIHPWIYLHSGESFRSDKLELVNASR